MKYVAVICGVIAATIIGLSWYLSPDDLAGCQAPAAGTCAPADAIVVVSGGDTKARVQEGVKLFKLGWGSRLIFSGAAADQTGLSNALAMKHYAVQLGVTDELISIEEFSRTTAENAANTSKLVQGSKKIILVTSAYHQRRASLEFGSYLSPDTTIINHPVATDRQWQSWWWLTPTGWWLALSELVKIVVFYVAWGVSR